MDSSMFLCDNFLTAVLNFYTVSEALCGNMLIEKKCLSVYVGCLLNCMEKLDGRNTKFQFCHVVNS